SPTPSPAACLRSPGRRFVRRRDLWAKEVVRPARGGCFCESTLDALDHDRHPADRLARELGLLDATMLVVASIIGAGIFLTPGTVADILPHPGLVLTAWTVGGVLSLAGALANAELAGMFP